MELGFYQYFQLLSLAMAIYCFRDLRKFRIQAFVPLLAVVVLVELLANNYIALGFSSTHFLVNLYILFSTWLYFLLFYRILEPKKPFKNWYLGISIFVSISFSINYLFIEGPLFIDTYQMILQQLFTIFLSCLVLFYLSISPRLFHILKHPYFWIAGGLLVFSLGTLVVFGLNDFIRKNQITIQNIQLYNVIMPLLNVILYSSYTIAFYLCRKTPMSYSRLS